MEHTDCPSVVLDGTRYYFRVTMAAIIGLLKRGVPISNPPAPEDLQANYEFWAECFSAYAFVEQDGQLKHAGVTPEQASNIIEIRTFPAMAAAIRLAVNISNQDTVAADADPQAAAEPGPVRSRVM